MTQARQIHIYMFFMIHVTGHKQDTTSSTITNNGLRVPALVKVCLLEHHHCIIKKKNHLALAIVQVRNFARQIVRV
jgi:hypothetical protein